MRALFARKDLRLLFGGQTVSMFGDWMMIIVLGIWAKTLTGSNSQAGLVFLVLGVTGLVAPLGGLVVDRLPKRPLMIATQLSLAGVMCLLLFVHDRGDMWILYGVTLLYGLGGDLFAASRGAMLKAMVPDELLGEANGAYQSIREGLRIVAPLAGAGIFAAWGGSVVAIVDAATFLVSAAALVALRFEEPTRAAKEHHLVKEISAGLTHIGRTRVLRELTIGLAAALLVAGFSETLIFAVTSDALHRSPSFVGVLGTAQGIGAIAGGVTSAWLMRRIGDVRLAGVGVAVFGIGDLFWMVPSVPVVLASTAIAGVGIVWAVVSLSTAYQRRSPNEVQGRVAAAANMLFSLPQTIGIAAGAALITLVDFRVEIVTMTVVFLAAGAYLLTRRPGEAMTEVEQALAA
jgi:MFS family permease